jgi:hypothetical protein
MNNYKAAVIAFALTALVGCAALADFAMSQATGSKGGINTELVLGDKEQVLGNNIEVKAKAVGKVVGTSDNSVDAPSAKQVTVNNNTVPKYVVAIVLVLAGLVGWLSPRPKGWKRLIKRKQDEYT